LVLLLPVLTVAGVNAWVRLVASGRLYTRLDAVPYNDVGLLLGTSPRLKSGAPNKFFEYRMDAAAELYHAGKIRHVLVSGGNPTRWYNESRDMERALVARGVPRSAVTRDYAGYRTLDSVLRAQAIFGQRRFTIISQSGHNRRAVFLARRWGIDAVAYNARDVGGRAAWQQLARETLACVKAALDAYVLDTQPRYYGRPEPIRLD